MVHTYSTERIFALKPSPSSICASSQIARSDTLNLKTSARTAPRLHTSPRSRSHMLCLCRLLPVSPRCRRPLCDVIETATSRGLHSEEQDLLHLDTFPTCSLSLLSPRSVCVFSLFFFWRSPGRFRASLALIALTERKTKRCSRSPLSEADKATAALFHHQQMCYLLPLVAPCC